MNFNYYSIRFVLTLMIVGSAGLQLLHLKIIIYI